MNHPLILSELSAAQWDEFVNATPNALPFHTSAWMQLLHDVYGATPIRLGFWENETLRTVLPLWRRRMGPFLLAGSPLMQTIASTPFIGPLGGAIRVVDLLPALNSYAHQQRIAYLELSLPHLLTQSEIADAVSLGYEHEICEAVLLKLTPDEDKLWSGLSSACRRAIRKAQTEGIQIIEPQNADFLPTYFSMVEEVYRKTDRPPHLSARFYQRAWELLYLSRKASHHISKSSAGFDHAQPSRKELFWGAMQSQNQLKTLLALRNGELLAGAMFVVHNQYAYYLSGASMQAALPLRPNNLLQWHFIQWAVANGIDTYDMGGAVVEGITRFKLGFGGQRYAYSRLYRSSSLLARLGRAVYARAIPWWRWLQKRG